LKEYDFFTYAKANGKDVTFVDPVEYSLEFDPKETVLTLHFVLPLKAPLKAKAVNLEVFDPSYFVDFSFAEKDAVALAGPEIKLTTDEITLTVGPCEIKISMDSISLNNGLIKVGLAGVSLVNGAMAFGVPPS